jgi:PAS domain S-box-containing protein
MKMKFLLIQKVQLAFGAALALLLVVGVVSYRINRNQVENEEWVAHTHEVLAAIEAVLSNESEAESAQRGYFITGEVSFWEEYHKIISTLQANLSRVRALTADNPAQQRRLDVFDPLIARRLALLEELIDLQKDHPTDTAGQKALVTEGHSTQLAIHRRLDEMAEAERILLQLRIVTVKASTHNAIITILLGICFALGLLCAVLYLLQRDISVRRDAEEHLVQMEGRYRGLLEAAPDAMVVVNQGGEIVLLNVQAEKQFGYRRDELVGQKVKNIIPEGFAERLIADGTRTAADALAQQIGTGIELTGRRKDGSDFPIEIMLSPLESAEGILVTAAIRDITERKKSEEHLMKTVGELKRSNEELQQFAYVASHDLQEPLRMVASYTQLLAKRYKGRLDSDADEFIAYAVDGCNRMQGLIQDLLAYSRAGTNGKELLKISSEKTLKDALANLRATIEESGAVVTHDALPAITTDDAQLALVFQNLVGNAIKYHGPEVPHVHVSATKNGGKEWIFSVRDNGMGIDPQYFERIFILFQRLHGRTEFKGTGIGLAICKKILERLGGRIWVESQPEKGSTFHFALPERDGK